MGRMKKPDMVEFIIKHTDSPEEDLEGMNIAELSKMVKQVRIAVKEHEEAQPTPSIVTPTIVPAGDIRSEIDEGTVMVGDRKVPVSAIVAYKGDDVHPKTGAHQIVVRHPDKDSNTMVTFEKRDKIFKGLPVAVVEDWRIRAQVLFDAHKFVINPTLGQQHVRVNPRPGYITPLDVNPNRGMIERMANYLRGTVSVADESDHLAQAVASQIFPDGG